MSIEGSGASRGGGDSFHNEDAFLVEEGLGLYVVCDGAGGRPAGEVAAHVAVEALEEFVAHADVGSDDPLGESRGATQVVEQGLRYAMRAVLDAARTDAELRGMVTTMTMLLAQGRHGVIGHVGDSRAYLVRRGRAHQLTIDHELTDAIAGQDETDAATASFSSQTFALQLLPGDTLILCTDGAEQVVQDRVIERAAGELSPALLASRIVSAAHRLNPALDATAVVVRVRDERERGWLELSEPPRRVAFGHTLTPA